MSRLQHSDDVYSVLLLANQSYALCYIRKTQPTNETLVHNHLMISNASTPTVTSLTNSLTDMTK